MSYFPALRPRFDAAVRDSRSKDARARQAAALRLGSPPEGREEEARRALRPLLDDPHPAVRQAAIASAGELRDREALDVILARFEDGEPAVRQLALIAAARIGDERAIEPVRRALADPRPEMRFQAAASFVELCPEQAVAAVAPLLEDDDPEVRGHAAEALGVLGDPRVADALAARLDDGSKVARREACMALAALGDPRAGPVLLECLADGEHAIEAALSLGELGVLDAREELAGIATRFLTPLHLKAAAGAALVRLGDPRGVEALRSVLRAFRHDGRSFAAQLAGEVGASELAPVLEDLLSRPRGADPEVVRAALGRLRPEGGAAASAPDGASCAPSTPPAGAVEQGT